MYTILILAVTITGSYVYQGIMPWALLWLSLTLGVFLALSTACLLDVMFSLVQ